MILISKNYDILENCKLITNYGSGSFPFIKYKFINLIKNALSEDDFILSS